MECIVTIRAISSLTNDSVKLIKSLEMRKARKETGLFVAEGASILITAAEHGYHPEMLVVRAGSAQIDELDGAPRELVDAAIVRGTEVMEVTPAILEKLSAKDNPQTMLGVFKHVWTDPPAPDAVGAEAVWLALEEVRDPGNLGTIVRTAEAAGVAGIILAGRCCDPWSRECVRATMGSIFAVPLVRMEIGAFRGLVAGWPGATVATHLDAAEDFRTMAYRSPTLLVMGGEGPGLSDATAQACARRVRIPMAGKLDSLNLAIATALVLYQIQGARLGRGG
jgi:RNA methyltransferase, TrmH family